MILPLRHNGSAPFATTRSTYRKGDKTLYLTH